MQIGRSVALKVDIVVTGPRAISTFSYEVRLLVSIAYSWSSYVCSCMSLDNEIVVLLFVTARLGPPA
jgi:hypothetical protein